MFGLLHSIWTDLGNLLWNRCVTTFKETPQGQLLTRDTIKTVILEITLL